MSDHWIDRSLPETPVPMPLALAAFNRRFVEVIESREIFDLLTGDRMSYADFRNVFQHQLHLFKENSSKVKEATEAWLESQEHPRCFRYTYEPGKEPFVHDCVNLWKDITPHPHQGDISPWTKLENHVFCDLSEEEKHWIRCWMAYPLQHPGTKLHTAVLMYSAIQGVGKGLLTETLKLLYGKHPDDSYSNAGTIGNMQLNSSFNQWLARRQLIVCDEISVPYKDREVVAERMKSLITEHTATVNQKYTREITLPNYANFIITSNSPAAIKIEDGDRRYFVVSSSAGQLDPEFAKQFIAWRDLELDPEDTSGRVPGLNALMHYFLNYDTKGFNPFAPAPSTQAKTEVVDNSSAPHESWLRDLKDRLDSYPDLITSNELYDEFKKDQKVDTYLSLNAFSTSMTLAGYRLASKESIMVEGKRIRLRYLKNAEAYRNMSDADKGRAYRSQQLARPKEPVSFSTMDLSLVDA